MFLSVENDPDKFKDVATLEFQTICAPKDFIVRSTYSEIPIKCPTFYLDAHQTKIIFLKDSTGLGHARMPVLAHMHVSTS